MNLFNYYQYWYFYNYDLPKILPAQIWGGPRDGEVVEGNQLYIREPIIKHQQFYLTDIKEPNMNLVDYSYKIYERFTSVLNNGRFRNVYMGDDLPYQRILKDYLYGIK